LWHIINKEKIPEIDFRRAVLDELLECKTVDLSIVEGIAKALEREYDYAISYFYDAMEKDWKGDILKCIDNATSLLCDRINYIIRIIEDIKNGRKNTRRKTENY